MKKHTRKILVVENKNMLREAYADFFKNTHYKVTTATNGSNAFELVANNEYDIVFTDYSMPHLNGVELLNRCQFLEKNYLPLS